MEFTLKTERLLIQPFRDSFLEAYYTEFTDEIVKYQYPDSFPDMNTANETVSMFVKDMERTEVMDMKARAIRTLFGGENTQFGGYGLECRIAVSYYPEDGASFHELLETARKRQSLDCNLKGSARVLASR